MTKYLSQSALGQYFGIYGNKLRKLQAVLRKEGAILNDQKTGIIYFEYDAVIQNTKPIKYIPEHIFLIHNQYQEQLN
jgi:hypothetical protein